MEPRSTFFVLHQCAQETETEIVILLATGRRDVGPENRKEGGGGEDATARG